MTQTASFDFKKHDMEFADEQMNRFIEHQLGKSKAEGTVLKYARGLEQYSDWLEMKGKETTDVDFLDLEQYLSYLPYDVENLG